METERESEAFSGLPEIGLPKIKELDLTKFKNNLTDSSNREVDVMLLEDRVTALENKFKRTRGEIASIMRYCVEIDKIVGESLESREE